MTAHPTREEIERTIERIFQEVLGLDVTTIPRNASLRDELEITSLAIIQIAFEIEEILGIEIDNHALLRMHSFSDVINELEAALALRRDQ